MTIRREAPSFPRRYIINGPMGKPIQYCGDCGRSLREDDFDRKKAGYLGNLPYCLDCRPDATAPETRPAPSSGSTSRLRSVPGAAPFRFLFARPSQNLPVGVLAAVGGDVVLLVLIVAVMSSSPPPPVSKPVAKAVELPPTPPPPRPEPPPPVRPEKPAPPRPAPAEPEPLRPRQDLPAVLDRFLGDIQTIRASDDGFKRAEEVRSMLRRAVEIAGPRKTEVEELLAAYEREIAASAAPKPAAPVVK